MPWLRDSQRRQTGDGGEGVRKGALEQVGAQVTGGERERGGGEEGERERGAGRIGEGEENADKDQKVTLSGAASSVHALQVIACISKYSRVREIQGAFQVTACNATYSRVRRDSPAARE